MKDLTFLIKIRVDSQIREQNIDSILKFINDNFETSVIVLEADYEQRYSPKHEGNSTVFLFKKDANPIFRLSYWNNQLIEMAKTPYVSIWDADAVCIPEQVVDAVNKLRANTAVMSFPFDGRYYSCDRRSSLLFKETGCVDILEFLRPSLPLMHGYHSVGGAFLANKEFFMEAGGDNENIYGWGLEDAERVKRMEVLGYPVCRTKGAMYHLWHPRGKNSWFANKETEKINRMEFSKTCAMRKTF